ncbi:MAG TPA: hypothetical protein VEW25_11455 [Allosphingosinicella sp.]|nr:hypothetical protein [Allosphingosinicella sp.]
MSIFPKIQSPCPYKSNLAEIMDGDVCRMCKRQVFELTHMSDGARVAFLAGCEEEVCVSYAIPIRPALKAAAFAAAIAIPSAAAAQDEMMIVVGGITDPSRVVMVDTGRDADLPVLPIAYEDEQPSDESPAGEALRDEPAGPDRS